MPKCPLPFYRVDDKPSRTVKVREDFSLYAVSTERPPFLANVPAFLYSPASSPFTPLSYLLLSLISFPPLSRRLDFPMQRYSGRPVSSTAMLTARGFARQPSQIEDVLSVPSLLRLSGWVFREIPGCLLAFPSFPRCLICM